MTMGKTQEAFLDCLKKTQGGWYPNCGWYWGNRSTSIRLAESLVKRGLVVKEQRPHLRGQGFYTVYKAIL